LKRKGGRKEDNEEKNKEKEEGKICVLPPPASPSRENIKKCDILIYIILYTFAFIKFLAEGAELLDQEGAIGLYSCKGGLDIGPLSLEEGARLLDLTRQAARHFTL